MGILGLMRQAKHKVFLASRRGSDQRVRDRLRRQGVAIDGETAWIHETARLDRGVSVASGVFINRDVHIEAGTRIGTGVYIGPRSFLCTRSHQIGEHSQRAGAATYGPITVDAGAWIGAYVVILPGVTIARGTVIGAGAVVTKDTSPNGVYAGVPAVRIRELG